MRREAVVTIECSKVDSQSRMQADHVLHSRGLPKSVAAIHHRVVTNAMQDIYARYLGNSHTPSNRWLTFLPWSHAHTQLFAIVITCEPRQRCYVMFHR